VQESNGNNRVCVLSASTFSQEGGIQRVTRMVLRCLRESWPDVGIALFSLHDHNTLAASPTLLEDMRAGDLRFEPCRSSRTKYSLGTLRNLIASRPGLVISEHAHLNVIPWLARPFANFRWVSLVYYLELATLGALRREAMRRCDLIIAISEFAARELRRVLGEDCPPVVVCHLGLNPEYVCLAKARQTVVPPLAGRRNVLIVGRMADRDRDKGHEALLRALPALAGSVPDVQLVIVGRGGDEPRLRRLATELKVEPFVHFAGCVPDHELPAYYDAAEIFAMPSYAEGFGLVYLEAMYHRIPCIAGNRDGASEVVLDGETGLLVEPGNVAKLQQALLRLLLERKLARTLGANGRDRLDRYFTYEVFCARLRKALYPPPSAPGTARDTTETAEAYSSH
jgi:glycosyltransferase involved in cell wall biosynthesis